ncbi:acyl-coenzyme A thioesterase 9, mitochondrial-like [Saccoglossus kowalevskii]|uniref:Acyl-coenzyme A thioesterase 9, mitochondrial-like n=1 Tax=Saccoglossus kowalevskii TaxID=10224 RepID=A0ABM0GW30_SACKO|nr:PREDICTED: acyl-coenzyme A thioesterase 9, mitochondrial-like [Saccoglossus kowalevskii]
MATILKRCLLRFTEIQYGGRHIYKYMSSTVGMPTIIDVRQRLSERVGRKEPWSKGVDRFASLKPAESQDELPIRSMKDSYQEAIIPLGSDVKLREKYMTIHNIVRFGRILENLDTFAVWICYQHNKIEEWKNPPIVIVTALVDRIDLQVRTILSDKDIILKGNVTWVGATSMEVKMHMEQIQDDGNWKQVMDASFMMVSRDPMNQRKAFVCPLKAESDEEKQLLMKGEDNRKRRIRESKESLLKTPPNADETALIHRLFLDTLDPMSVTFKARVKPDGAVWMEDAKLKNIIICHPEERNLYNKVFGGFLMRQALELAWANAWVYCKSRTYLIAVDDIVFRKPVKIGSLLYLASQVAYTEGCYLQVRVHAEVVDPTTGQHETTNDFHFTFDKRSPVSPVMPKTYPDAMLYLDGKRHFREAEVPLNSC